MSWHETGFKVTGGELNPTEKFPFAIQALDVTNAGDLTETLKKYDAIISCLPYHFNIGVARVAAQLGVHYFDLTEDVSTTKEIIKMSMTAPCVMAPQCGLAPGFIAIVGASLASKFDKIRSIKLRVGALPKHHDRSARLCLQLVTGGCRQ